MTARNPHRGTVSIAGLGTLRYDWERIAQLIGLLGPSFDSKIAEAAMRLDLDTIANVLAIGLDDGGSADQIKSASPPLKLCIEAITAALKLAFEGPEGTPPAGRDKNPPQATKAPISSAKGKGRRSGRG